jgi:ABC-2 type transport system ATP-binding protein/lipopolysaccharide transport system ATP-binding protein
MARIELRDVGVSFPVYDSSTRSLKNRLMPGATGGNLHSEVHQSSVVQALTGVTGALRDGDRVGLIGHNGAGKSTLLRVLAGVYEPCVGSVEIEGHVAPLFDIALGMDPEATGYENIVLRGLFLGLSRKQILAKVPEIAEFTELGDFLHLPVRTYSEGMRLRLAFAVSTAIDPEILLLDEGISAGDAAFLGKANARLRRFASRAAIIVLASHSEPLIRAMCNLVVLFERGRVVAGGEPDAIFDLYRRRSAA